ncbi:MAG: 50S ribosomal protein L15 [Fretibacterium sp.]|nr:50S ribosomal protein L15 [Fretibacterium sp.]
MNLHDLRPAHGSRRKPKRLGKGIASGSGKTAGKGHKGHKARAGGGVRAGFEGGQMPMVRRIPKSGFNNARFAKVYQIVNLFALSEKFNGGEVGPQELRNAGLIRSLSLPVKLLAKGEVNKAFTVKAHAVSKGARAKIEAAGGKVEVI